MNKILTFVLVALPFILLSQNVGINITNPAATLHIIGSPADEPGLRVTNGLGDGAVISINDAASDGVGLNIFSEGIGRALNVQAMSPTSNANMLFLYNEGLGRGLELIQNNPSNNAVTALIVNKGMDDALQVSNTNVLSDQPTGSFFHNGVGYAMSVVQQNDANTTSALYVSNNATQTSGANDGLAVFAQSQSLRAGYFTNKGTGPSSAGIYGRNDGGGTGVAAGVIASAGGIDSIFAVYGFGDIAAASKSFLIDHPLDPANKTLKHFSIESDEPMLIYRGKVTLDSEGKAVVQIKDYQNAILQNITYNITAIGSPVVAYVHSEMDEKGQFVIAGNIPGATINWTLFGERADAYFEYYPQKKEVERLKTGRAKGKFLYPEVHGQPMEMGLDQRFKVENVPLEQK